MLKRFNHESWKSILDDDFLFSDKEECCKSITSNLVGKKKLEWTKSFESGKGEMLVGENWVQLKADNDPKCGGTNNVRTFAKAKTTLNVKKAFTMTLDGTGVGPC